MINKKLNGFLKKVLFYYPFSPAGTLLFLICFWILVNGLSTKNPYNTFLSTVGLSLIILLAIIGRIKTVFMLPENIKWDSSPPLYAEIEGQYHKILFGKNRAPLFYRLHFTIVGKLKVGNKASCYILKEGSSFGNKPLEIPLNFLFSGIANVRGVASLRDVFGLIRARVGHPFQRTLIVQPAPLHGYKESFIKALGGQEDKTIRKNAEEERYYMREYIPGDRFRDINWKSSSRLSQLITRISPHSQEKTKSIHVEFRHFWTQKRESRETIAHLNLIKSALMFFLKEVKEENPEFNFVVNTARGIYFLKTEEDLENFGLELSTIFFERDIPTNQYTVSKSKDTLSNRYSAKFLTRASPNTLTETPRELYIFSTPYDLNLPARINALRGSKIYLFVTRQENKKPYLRNNKRSSPPSKKAKDQVIKQKTSRINIGTNEKNNNEKKASRLTKRYVAIKSLLSYPIPGVWIFRSDRVFKDFQSVKTIDINFIEFPLEVRLIE